MTLWVCLTCTTKYAVGLFKCPRCHGKDFVEDGQPMPKISRSGGASNAGATATPAPVAVPDHIIETAAPLTVEQAEELRAAVNSEHGPELLDLPYGATARDAEPEPEGGEESSPGNSSSPSTEKPPTSSEQSKPVRRKPARTTGSRSAPDRTETSTAHLTAGDQTAPTSEPDRHRK